MSMVRNWAPPLADPAPAWQRPRTVWHQAFITLVVVLGVGAGLWAVAAQWQDLFAAWASLLLGLGALLTVSPFLIQMNAGGNAVHLGVAVSVLAFMNYGHSPVLTLAMWTLISIAYQMILRRPLKSTALWTGVEGLAVVAFLATVESFPETAVGESVGLVGGITAYILVYVVLSQINTALGPRREGAPWVSPIRWSRMATLWFINVAFSLLSLGAYNFSTRGVQIPGTDLSAGSVTYLIMICLLVHIFTLRSTLRQTRLKLNVVLDAAKDLPWREAPAPAERLRTFTSVAIPGEAVVIQDDPPRTGQLGSPIEFPDGHGEYIVITRTSTLESFTLLEEQILQGLAHMASATLRVNHGMAELEIQAATDELTGLLNYRAFLDALAAAAARHSDFHRLAILYIDVDGMKGVNDTLGHDAGNQLLTVLSQRVRKLLREDDIVARVGGDEFVVILSSIAGPSDAEKIRQRVEAEIAAPLLLSDHWLKPSASVGLACSTPGDGGIEELVNAADRDMYRRKTERRAQEKSGVDDAVSEEAPRIKSIGGR
ncbi:GGDEF domain-containing protein [Arthrobacter sp. 35W]|uniref:GGDEF domain-containing protein n=1 Tax=Arthrobacter sp. 35W TaxID=1132441 RepID=UPI0004156419|nr:GGDEF domain-containing protein [Arthrobacter sp. 35W]